jgi:hypothetical protein
MPDVRVRWRLEGEFEAHPNDVEPLIAALRQVRNQLRQGGSVAKVQRVELTHEEIEES